VGGATDVNRFLADCSASVSPYLTTLSVDQAIQLPPKGRKVGEYKDKGKGKGKAFHVHTTKAYRWSNVKHHKFLTGALDGGELSTSRRGCFTPRKEPTDTHGTGSCMGPRVGLDAGVVNNELARTWKEAIEAESRVLSLYLPVGTDKTTRSFGEVFGPSLSVHKNAANSTNDCSHSGVNIGV